MSGRAAGIYQSSSILARVHQCQPGPRQCPPASGSCPSVPTGVGQLPVNAHQCPSGVHQHPSGPRQSPPELISGSQYLPEPAGARQNASAVASARQWPTGLISSRQTLCPRPRSRAGTDQITATQIYDHGGRADIRSRRTRRYTITAGA